MWITPESAQHSNWTGHPRYDPCRAVPTSTLPLRVPALARAGSRTGLGAQTAPNCYRLAGMGGPARRVWLFGWLLALALFVVGIGWPLVNYHWWARLRAWFPNLLSWEDGIPAVADVDFYIGLIAPVAVLLACSVIAGFMPTPNEE